MKQYYQEHRDIIIDRERRFYQVNKSAISEKTAERRKKNGHIWNENRRKKKMENPLPILLTSAKVRAKKQGLDFDISGVDVCVPKTCPVLGIPLFVSTKKACDNSPTLDRIDNTKGYIKGNVIVVSYRANTIKNYATTVELEQIAKFYRGLA